MTDHALDYATALGVTVLIGVGFITSYTTLSTLAAERGQFPPWLAAAVPLAFDAGIITLSLKVCRLAREGRSALALRLVIAGLSVSTVVANSAAGADWPARLLHAVPPAMFVVCFESVIVSVRRHALQRMGLLPAPLPRVRGVRWLLDPWPTWCAWRAMVLADTDLPRPQDVLLETGRPQRRAAIDSHADRRTPLGRPADERELLTGGPSPNAAGALDGRALATPTSAGVRTRSATEQRLAAAMGVLQQQPNLSAPKLAIRLRTAGHRLSDRTARRVRTQALALRGAPRAGTGVPAGELDGHRDEVGVQGRTDQFGGC
jgi:hypothetical protein